MTFRSIRRPAFLFHSSFFPFLVDEGQGVSLFESEDICAHLLKHYGDGVNGAVDLYTKAPIGKFELIKAVEEKYGLIWNVEGNVEILSNTGVKLNYVPECRGAAMWGYEPAYNSLDGLMHELEAMVQGV